MKKNKACRAKIFFDYSFLFFILLSFSALAKSEAWPPDHLAFILGDWEYATSGNRFIMRVEWDGSNNEFLGHYIRLGKANSAFGAQIGQHVWTAKIKKNGALIEYIISHTSHYNSTGGISYGTEWSTGKMHLERCSLNTLVSEFGTFTRVASKHSR